MRTFARSGRIGSIRHIKPDQNGIIKAGQACPHDQADTRLGPLVAPFNHHPGHVHDHRPGNTRLPGKR